MFSFLLDFGLKLSKATVPKVGSELFQWLVAKNLHIVVIYTPKWFKCSVGKLQTELGERPV